MVLQLLPHAGKAPSSECRWLDGWYCRDFTRHASVLNAVGRLQRERYGRLNIASLLATPIIGHGLLLHAAGREVKPSDFAGLPTATASVGDLVELQWVRQKLTRFRLRAGTYPYPAVDAFRLLCDLLVFNYPGLLAAHPMPDTPQERGPGGDVWSLAETGDGPRLMRTVGSAPPVDLGVVHSHPHAQAVARQATGRPRIHFAPHPLLGASLPLWGSTELFGKKRLRALVEATASARASRELEARSTALDAQSTDLSHALAQVGWDTVHRLSHSASRQRLLFYKIKGLRLSGWDVLHNRRGCPHCDHLGSTGGDTYHIVWTCPSAQRLWRAVRSWWASLALWTEPTAANARDFITAIFSHRLPSTPPKVWVLASLSQCSTFQDTPEGPYPAMQAAWQQVVLETLVVILGWRRSRFDPARAWSTTQAAVYHDAGCQRVLDTLALRCSTDARTPRMHVQLIRELRGHFDQLNPAADPPGPPPSPADAIHVLFFDGGSHGNPGPGGSGACVVRVDTTTGAAKIVWSAAMSHAHRSTTNNQAEYRGLITGLRAARHFQWPALEVVGDSALILRQLRDYRPPKYPRLLLLYSQARRLADHVGIKRWTHHVRAHNKMADALANLAMDQRSSSQVHHPSARSGHCDLAAHLSHDLRQWRTNAVGHHAGLRVLL